MNLPRPTKNLPIHVPHGLAAWPRSAAGTAILLVTALAVATSPRAVHGQEADSSGNRPTRDGTATNGSVRDRRDSTGIFAPLDLPEPDAYRTAAGAPGPEYWQQRVDYEIDVRLDPESRVVSGSQTITYQNRSPHPLGKLWLQLDQNLFDPTSPEARRVRRGWPEDRPYPDGGYEISDVRLRRGDRTMEPGYSISGTLMSVTLPEPLLPNGRAELSLDFRFEIPSSGAGRMGYLDVEDGTVFQLAQWYPRTFVYDDVHGWNAMRYMGQGEFYLEYGSFDVSVTLPREYVVAATGQLQNPEDVLTPVQRQRLERARESSETVHVVREEEVGDPASRPSGEGPLTWRFRADSVRDFSWAASEAFIWDAASWRDVLLMSLYPREGLGSQDNPGWERSTQIMRHSVSHYSDRWEPYPYPEAINVAGRVGGMEYPMIVFCSVRARSDALFRVTDHEIGHAWFPMLVGSDERRYVWMDEGVTSLLNYYSDRDFRSEPMRVANRSVMAELARGMEQNTTAPPILTYSDRMPGRAYAYLGYGKPSLALVLLREYVLEPDRFDAALREYIHRWRFRHPKPADFFRTIEDVTGEELGWFWRGWFGSSRTLDQAVSDVSVTGDTTWITLENREGLVMPVRLEIEYADGSTETRRIPVDVWRRGDSHVLFVIGRQVEAVRVDPDHQLPDVDRDNNAREPR